MMNETDINGLIKEAYEGMESTKKMFGKEIYQKRFNPVFEGYLTALCAVLEKSDDDKTEIIRGKV